MGKKEEKKADVSDGEIVEAPGDEACQNARQIQEENMGRLRRR